MSREVPVRFREGLGVQFPRATRLVICCRGNAQAAMQAMRNMMQRIKLTVNETKTHTCRVPDESFDFLGYTFGLGYAPRTGQAYIGARPSQKKVTRLCQAISALTDARTSLMDTDEMVDRLNRMISGWANYFSHGSIHRAYRVVNYHAYDRLRHWLCRKHKVPGRGNTRFPMPYVHGTLGLIELRAARRRLPRANA